MNYTFHLPNIETRKKEVDGIPTYVVRGYATVPNYVYTYKTQGERAFREFFSQRAIEHIKEQVKNKKIFVDVEHSLGTKESVSYILEQIRNKTGADFDEELDYINRRFRYADIPMFKVEDIQIDEKGLFIDIRGNPFYREIDDEHKTYFDAVWGSLEKGFINGMSLNFKPKSTVKINDSLTQIDEVDIYGISLTGSPSNDMATITEVAMRSIENIRGELKCPKRKMTSLML